VTGHGESGSAETQLQYIGRAVSDQGRNVRRVRAAVKRSFDFVAAGTLLMILAPLFLVVSVAIRLDSRGPAFFHQDRVGAKPRFRSGVTEWEARTFQVHKFRSMAADSDDSAHQDYITAFVEGSAEESGKEGSTFKLVDDPRVTRLGRLLRKTSIDELPQLLNVLAGDMSLVGPRPVPIYEARQYETWQMERLHARPGMTGYWQVYGRGQVTFEEMMRMDIFYVRNQSLFLDLKLLALTVPAVVSGRGAE
jgi:lipopolysaccharide/colanic/teichoic acid biosynthesis glycosyltransferase